MKKQNLVILLFTIIYVNMYAQEVYVDSNTGDDNNPGTQESPVFSIYKAMEIINSTGNDIYTMKINPGLYVLNHPLSVSTEKEMANKRLEIEAGILPGDDSWTPEKMPVIISTSKKGEVTGQNYHFVVSFLVEESHVTLRGLKFPGYFYPNTRYFPIARFDKTKEDLYVEQCLFVGDEDASHLQVGIIAHGNGIRADHCIFYNVRNSVVFWQDDGSGSKTGNGITNSIIYGATQSGVWTAWPDNDFIFKNNIVSNCKNAWIKNSDNPTVYTIDSCIIVNNKNYLVSATNSGLIPEDFTINENSVIKEGKIHLVPKSEMTHNPLPENYLHVVQDSLGYEMGTGLFKKKVETNIEGTGINTLNKPIINQVTPNPFNSSTNIMFSLPGQGLVKGIIYDNSGQELEILIDEYKQGGEHETTWLANGFPSGMYLFKLNFIDKSSNLGKQSFETKKLIYLK